VGVLARLIMKEMAIVALLHNLYCITFGYWPVKAMPESFFDNDVIGRVWSIYTTVDVIEKFDAFSSWYALHHQAIGAPSK
jgi:hypothetical protein